MLFPTMTTLACGAVWFGAPMAARRLDELALRRRCRSTGTLVLTFDDGPGERLTPALLEVLASHRARATFFVSGAQALAQPQLVDRLREAGHEIGCHGHDHVHAWRVPPWRAVRDVRRGYRALERWVPGGGLFRPPYGKLTPLTWVAARRRGARLGWWTIAGGDVQATLPPVDTAVEAAERAGGGVVLLHDFDRPEQFEEHAAFVLGATNLLLHAALRHGWAVRTLGEMTRA